MLNFEQKIEPEIKKEKSFDNLEVGTFFVWADNINCLFLKITETCYYEIATHDTFTTRDDIDRTDLSALDISDTGYNGQFDAVFDVEFEDCTVKWTVVK